MTPEQIKARCARAVCNACLRGVKLELESVRYGPNYLEDKLAFVHYEGDFKKACDADNIYKIPDAELT